MALYAESSHAGVLLSWLASKPTLNHNAPEGMHEDDIVERSIARINIAHYRLTLSVEHDDIRRQTLHRLLAKEQVGLPAVDSALIESKNKENTASVKPARE